MDVGQLELMVEWIKNPKPVINDDPWWRTKVYDSYKFALGEDKMYECSLIGDRVMLHDVNLPYHVVSVGFEIDSYSSQATVVDHYCLFGHQMFMLKDGSLTDFHRTLFDIIHVLAKAKGVKTMVAYHQYGVYNYQDCFEYRVKNNLPLFFTELGYVTHNHKLPVTKKTKLIKTL